MIIEELVIDLGPVDLFAHCAERKDTVFLDSSRTTPYSRYSVLGLAPSLTLKAWGELVSVSTAGQAITVRAKPLDVLKMVLRKKKITYEADFPLGAAMGYIGYETGYTLEEIRTYSKPGLHIPDCYLNFYDSLLLYDHDTNRYFCTSAGEKIGEEIKEVLKNAAKLPETKRTPCTANTISSSTSRSDFMKGVEVIKEYIRRGDVYQVNLSQRFSAGAPDNTFALYRALRALSPVPHGAFLNLDGFQVLSLSPERFIRIDGRRAQTRPVKGTTARGTNELEDGRRRASLYDSTKDRAELLMITDLERNDLGRVCSPHTISVPDLLGIEEYSSVFHLVSTIEGKLAPGRDHVDCLAAMFPGGSITGAPKIRAMEIIEELEPVRRNVYTGAIGYIGYNDQSDLNIAIRTATVFGGHLYFNGGGGIVIDSDPEAEYEETLHKVKPFLDALDPGSYEAMLGKKEIAIL